MFKGSSSRAGLWIGLLLAGARLCWGYSLLTHEEIVDILWKDQIRPMLLKRYPAASQEELRKAHAYAYGGCLIHDMGYYPFGNKFFSDLTHYVRTGDFVAINIKESTNIYEYAFALGTLCHYSSDYTGHPFINHAVAVTFPKLRAQYGEKVTYEQNPSAHIKVEFGFDVTQVAKNRYTSEQFHDFIGFEVSKPLLERAFFRTYGLKVNEVIGHEDLAIGTFRHAASDLIPDLTRGALGVYHAEAVTDIQDRSEKRFLFNLSRAQYATKWGKNYRKPGFFAQVLQFTLAWVPEIPWFKSLVFVVPTPETQDLYFKSINKTVDEDRRLLCEVESGNLHFPNRDCDTGQESSPGEYGLTDDAYAQLLEQLVKHGLERVEPDLRANILAFYADPSRPKRAGISDKSWRRTMQQLQALKEGPNSAAAAEIRKFLLAPPFKLESPKAKAG